MVGILVKILRKTVAARYNMEFMLIEGSFVLQDGKVCASAGVSFVPPLNQGLNRFCIWRPPPANDQMLNGANLSSQSGDQDSQLDKVQTDPRGPPCQKKTFLLKQCAG